MGNLPLSLNFLINSGGSASTFVTAGSEPIVDWVDVVVVVGGRGEMEVEGFGFCLFGSGEVIGERGCGCGGGVDIV